MHETRTTSLDHRYEVDRLLAKGYPGVNRENADRVYQELHKARRGGRLKRFGDVVPLLPADPRLILAIDQANRETPRSLAK